MLPNIKPNISEGYDYGRALILAQAIYFENIHLNAMLIPV